MVQKYASNIVIIIIIIVVVVVITAQCTLVHMRGLGIACRPSVRLSLRL